ncbi:MAG TPA: hypothetical protein PK504_02245 [Ferruginibacter sp.]|nr:hypothetical protein [Ferruginibacter sp.]HRE63375.1 hypothetical protein [Ferruginibacter sp.]
MKRKSDLYLVIYATLLIIISIFSISIISPSCKKMDVHVGNDTEIQSRFFNVPNNEAAVVHKVAAALKKQNNIGGFIPSFAKKEGYAVWDKSLIYYPEPLTNTYGRNGENETQDTIEVFTPIVLENDNIVNGFFFSRIVGDSVALHLYRANDYDLFPNGKIDSTVVTAELIIIKLLQLNDEIFGHKKYELLDSNAFKKEIHGKYRTIELDTNSNNNGGSETGRIKVRGNCTFTCYYNQTPECISTTNWCTFCQLYYCYSNCPSTPGSGTGTGSPSGGGGGYNWPPDPPIATGGSGGGGGSSTGNCIPGNCRTSSTLIVEGRVPCGGCGGGPIIILPPEEPPYIPSEIDTSDLRIISEKISNQSDSLFNWAFLPGNNLREQGAIIVRKNGNIYLKNIAPGKEGKTRPPNYSLETGEELIGYYHTHPVDTSYKQRSFFSDDDFLTFHSKAITIQGYMMVLECGNKRFIVVVENLQKYNEFMTFNRKMQIRNRYIEYELLPQQSTYYTNGQLASTNAALQFFGSSSNCGLGIYEANSPGKTNFTKLNP